MQPAFRAVLDAEVLFVMMREYYIREPHSGRGWGAAGTGVRPKSRPAPAVSALFIWRWSEPMPRQRNSNRRHGYIGHHHSPMTKGIEPAFAKPTRP